MDKLILYLKEHQAGKKAKAFIRAYIIGCVILSSIIGIGSLLFDDFSLNSLGSGMLFAIVGSFTSLLLGVPLGLIYFIFYVRQTDYSQKKKILNVVITFAVTVIFSGIFLCIIPEESPFEVLIGACLFGAAYGPVIAILTWYFHNKYVENNQA